MTDIINIRNMEQLTCHNVSAFLFVYIKIVKEVVLPPSAVKYIIRTARMVLNIL